MDISIELNGTPITQYVVSYSREQKICTGIGTLDIVVYETAPISFTTWDNIDLYEEGGYVGRFFVSTISSNQPQVTKTVSCQDTSKRIVDYMIIDSYEITYPSTTRY